MRLDVLLIYEEQRVVAFIGALPINSDTSFVQSSI